MEAGHREKQSGDGLRKWQGQLKENPQQQCNKVKHTTAQTVKMDM